MTPPFLYDLLLIVGLFLSGLGAMLLGYRLGGRVWTCRFAIRTGANGTEQPGKIWPGQYGEAASLGMIYGLVYLVDRFTPDVLLHRLLAAYWPVASAVVVAGFAVIAFYAHRVCRDAGRKERHGVLYCRRLARGYAVYNLYSVINFLGILLLPLMIFLQFDAEAARFRDQHETLRQSLQALALADAGDPGWIMARTESVYGQTRIGAAVIVDQINSLLLLVLAALIAHFVVVHTPVRQAYDARAIAAVNMVLMLSLGFVGLAAWGVYFSVYAGFFDETLVVLRQAGERIEQGSWEMISRYHDLLFDLSARRGLTGFALALTSERGGVLILLGVVHWLFSMRRV
ncbi:MAG: hypothetical protein CVT80_02800 [Alphaproteobacteria bacterium HGW-Alphaproteobacteria-2]|nr:MAG: hypothetical protein CVT80_02800 [Alphaproteobacteria bacterium HGW-Alphaproteobacteria-2]